MSADITCLKNQVMSNLVDDHLRSGGGEVDEKNGGPSQGKKIDGASAGKN